jgi:pyrroline-5-carboxylate reductase
MDGLVERPAMAIGSDAMQVQVSFISMNRIGERAARKCGLDLPVSHRLSAYPRERSMSFQPALDFGAPLGLFGAGHLGRALARALLDAGWPREQLLICHGGSANTVAALEAAGLGDRVVSAPLLAERAKLVFYLVRPQSVDVIAGLAMRPDALLVSFLAGIDMQRIPVGATARLRAMMSDPASLAKRNGIAALYPKNEMVEQLLRALGLRVTLLGTEADTAAFTALGTCLPMAAAWCLGYDRPIDRAALDAAGRRHDLAGYADIVDWAFEVCPKGVTRKELETYLTHAATPGGITEAVLNGLAAGDDIATALERGVRRCEELAKG